MPMAIAILAGLTALVAVPRPAPASAHHPGSYPNRLTTRLRQGQSLDILPVLDADHQHSRPSGAEWHTHAGAAGTQRLRPVGPGPG